VSSRVMSNEHESGELRLTAADIGRAADEGVLSRDDAQRLITWGFQSQVESSESSPPSIEQAKGFNLVTVAYYFGAMLMISASAWFLGDKWDVLGPSGILTTVLVYALIATAVGCWVRSQGYIVGGGLLITVAVCLTPLIVYAIEDLFGIWPAGRPGNYEDYFPWINGSWIVMELATIVVAAIALYFVRFGFLTAPLAFSFWFLSMDIGALILGKASLEGDEREWISVVVGVITIVVGYVLDRYLNRSAKTKSDDFAFWCYLFGTMAFWGGLTAMDSDSELGKAGYALINLLMIGVALRLRRTVFLVFGALGFHIYLGHLAYAVFEDSFFFPFVIAFLGLSMILVTVFVQRYFLKRATPLVE